MSHASNHFGSHERRAPTAPAATLPAREFCAMLWRQWRIGLLACLLVVFYVVVERRVVPPTYRAGLKLRLATDRPLTSVLPFDANAMAYLGAVQSQCTMIGSQPVLRGVVRGLKLSDRWMINEDEAVDELTSQVSVHPTRDREMIQVDARSADPALALQIADAIFDEYGRQAVASRQQQSVEALAKMRVESERQYRVMRNAQDELLIARKRLAIQSASSGKLSDSPEVDPTQLPGQLAKLRSDISEARWRLEMLRVLGATGARAEQLTMLRDEQANRLHEQAGVAGRQLALTREHSGQNHPSVQRQAAALAGLQASLKDRIDELVSGQQVALDAQVLHLKSLERENGGGEAQDGVASVEQLCENAAMEVDLQTKVYQSLRDRLQRSIIESQMPNTALQIVERPSRAVHDVNRRLCDMPFIAAGLALLMGIIAARVADGFDASVRSASDVTTALGVPAFASVPGRPRQLDDPQITAQQIEAYRMTVARLRFADPQNLVRTLAVVSATRGEGRSITVANLACLYAAQGQRVLVVDTDLTGASMHTSFDVTPSPGLMDFLEGSATADAVIAPTNVANIWLTPAGTPGLKTSPTPLAIAALMRQVERRFDLVIFDTAPLCDASDAAVVAREAHHVLYVARAGACSRKALSATSELLEQASCTVLGAVFNKLPGGRINLRPESHLQPLHYSIARTRVMRDRVQAHEQAKARRAA